MSEPLAVRVPPRTMVRAATTVRRAVTESRLEALT
jgi:hypothetical protein